MVGLAGQHFPDWDRPTGRPSALSMVDAGRLTLCRLRRTATYQDLHADLGIGKTTAWDDHQKIVNFLAEVLGAAGEDSLSALVEGTLVPTFHWRHRSDLASGKHRRSGVNVAASTRATRPAQVRQSSLPRELA